MPTLTKPEVDFRLHMAATSEKLIWRHNNSVVCYSIWMEFGSRCKMTCDTIVWFKRYFEPFKCKSTLWQTQGRSHVSQMGCPSSLPLFPSLSSSLPPSLFPSIIPSLLFHLLHFLWNENEKCNDLKCVQKPT